MVAFLGAGDASPVHKNTFLGADDGMTRPQKWFHAKEIITFSYDLG
jgi:hypothetical protein